MRARHVLVAIAVATVALASIDLARSSVPVSSDSEVGASAFVAGARPDPSAAPSTFGAVGIPATGGAADRAIDHVGPVTAGDPPIVMVESGASSSHAQGTLGSASADAGAAAETHGLRVFDNGSPPNDPVLAADLAHSDTGSTARASGASTTGKTLLVHASMFRTDVCAALGLVPAANDPPDSCEPAPNTDACAALGFTALCASDGISITLNEQSVDPASTQSNHAGLTVRAIHVRQVQANSFTGLPAGAEVIIAEAHSGATFVQPTGSADLSVGLSASPGRAKTGKRLVYTARVSNAGPDAASDPRLVDALPATVRFTGLQAPTGWSCVTPTTNTITCMAASLVSRTSVAITITVVVVSVNDGTIFDRAQVSSRSADPDQTNNVATVGTPVRGGRP
jgi:uncharacterized repeat protein (TIGR01451 family)